MTQPRGQLDCHGASARQAESEHDEERFAIAALRRSVQMHGTNLDVAQDANLFGPTVGHLFVVADGVGERAEAARASRLATRGLVEDFLEAMPWDEQVDAQEFRLVLRRCHERLLDLSADADGTHHPASTLTVAYVEWPDLHVAHLGAGRAALLRAGTMLALTGEAGEAKKTLDPADVLGGSPVTPRPTLVSTQLELGDTLVLCTDGVARTLGDEEIRVRVSTANDAKQAARYLVGKEPADDRTAVVAHFRPHRGHPQPVRAKSPSPRTARRSLVQRFGALLPKRRVRLRTSA